MSQIQTVVSKEDVIRAAKSKRATMVGKAWDASDPDQMDEFAEWFMDLLWDAMKEQKK